MDLRLQGKAAIVSGGSKGIGKAVARQLAREGVDVAIAARNIAELNAAATEIANETGLSREQLYRSFSDNGNPTLKTTLAVMKALNIELTAKTAG